MSQTYSNPPAYGTQQQPQQMSYGIQQQPQQMSYEAQQQPKQMAYGLPQQPQQVVYGAPVPQQVYASPHPPMVNPQGAVPPQPWANRFCGGYSPCSVCCEAYWCPCFLFGKIHHRVRNQSMTNYSSFNVACLGYCVALHFGFAWVPQMLQRGEIRAKYNLKGSSCGDCCRSYWCSWRELLQEEKEMRLRTQGQQPLQPPQQGYQTVNEGMAYVPKH